MISILLGENSLKLPQDSGVAYKYNKLVGLTHILAGQREARAHSQRERERERERARAHSQTAADEIEAKLNTTHKVYIESSWHSLTPKHFVSRDNHVVDF